MDSLPTEFFTICDWYDEFCDCRDPGTVCCLITEEVLCARHYTKRLAARGRTAERLRGVSWGVASPRWIPLRFSGGQKRSDAQNRLPRAQQKAQELQKQLPRPVLQLPRRTRSQHLSQNQAQVEPAHVDQLPLQNIFVSAQMAAPQPARFVTMR